MEQISLAAAAKINLTLDILGKRADGFHEVAMLMQSLALADRVKLARRTDGRITLSVIGNDKVPVDETNLAWRAAQVFLEVAEKFASALPICRGADIIVEKRIPMAAGLAGGSTDAAAVLIGMNKLSGDLFTESELCDIGAKIGSDIPFCIVGGTCEATGRGEVLTKLPLLPKKFVVLAKPPIEVSTAWAYKSYDACPAVTHPDNQAAKAALAAGDGKKLLGLLCNVLESVTIKEYPVIDEYKRLLVQVGMDAALMSGSGPTVFSLTDSEAVARSAAEFMRQNTDAQVIFTATGFGDLTE